MEKEEKHVKKNIKWMSLGLSAVMIMSMTACNVEKEIEVTSEVSTISETESEVETEAEKETESAETTAATEATEATTAEVQSDATVKAGVDELDDECFSLLKAKAKELNDGDSSLLYGFTNVYDNGNHGTQNLCVYDETNGYRAFKVDNGVVVETTWIPGSSFDSETEPESWLMDYESFAEYPVFDNFEFFTGGCVDISRLDDALTDGSYVGELYAISGDGKYVYALLGKTPTFDLSVDEIYSLTRGSMLQIDDEMLELNRIDSDESFEGIRYWFGDPDDYEVCVEIYVDEDGKPTDYKVFDMFGNPLGLDYHLVKIAIADDAVINITDNGKVSETVAAGDLEDYLADTSYVKYTDGGYCRETITFVGMDGNFITVENGKITNITLPK